MDTVDDGTLRAAEELVMRWDWDSSTSDNTSSRRLFDGEHRAEAERYLRAVDEIRRMSIRRSPDTENPRKAASDSLQIAMARLAEEFSLILTTRGNDLDGDTLHRDFSNISLLNSFAEYSLSMRSDVVVGEEVEEEEGEGNQLEMSRIGSSALSSVMSRVREIDLMPSDAVLDLRSIAEQMVNAGFEAECFQAYIRARNTALDHSLRKLGVDQLASGNVQSLSSDAVDSKIKRWIRAACTAVRLLFASERRLCDLVFDSLAADRDITTANNAFLEIVKDAAYKLLRFPDDISTAHHSPEKLFKIVDLHNVLKDLLPDIEFVFGDPNSPSQSSIQAYAVDILTRLTETIQEMLVDLEKQVYGKRSNAPVPGGNVHPMTRYVMNYLNFISDYKQSLQNIVISIPSPSELSLSGNESPPRIDLQELGLQSPLSMHLVWLIALLCLNLEGGASLYRETGLSNVFLMNNFYYIVHKVRDNAGLMEMIGGDYLKVLMGKYQREATNYHRAVWVNILHCLRDEGIHAKGSFSSGPSNRVLRERFKEFNLAFAEAHRTQQAWIVPDSQLKEELRIKISMQLLPAYGGFLGRYRQFIESGRHPEQYIKYSVDDLDQALGDFFEGISQRRWR